MRTTTLQTGTLLSYQVLTHPMKFVVRQLHGTRKGTLQSAQIVILVGKHPKKYPQHLLRRFENIAAHSGTLPKVVPRKSRQSHCNRRLQGFRYGLRGFLLPHTHP